MMQLNFFALNLELFFFFLKKIKLQSDLKNSSVKFCACTLHVISWFTFLIRWPCVVTHHPKNPENILQLMMKSRRLLLALTVIVRCRTPDFIEVLFVFNFCFLPSVHLISLCNRQCIYFKACIFYLPKQLMFLIC